MNSAYFQTLVDVLCLVNCEETQQCELPAVPSSASFDVNEV